jgi:riboflavin biosynthesis pyrimidine reductase
VVVGPNTRENTLEKMQEAGLDVICSTNPSPRERFQDLLKELGRRRMTNMLVEGRPTVMGALLDAGFIDEVHAFIATVTRCGRTEERSDDRPKAHLFQTSENQPQHRLRWPKGRREAG